MKKYILWYSSFLLNFNVSHGDCGVRCRMVVHYFSQHKVYVVSSSIYCFELRTFILYHHCCQLKNNELEQNAETDFMRWFVMGPSNIWTFQIKRI